MHDNDAGHGRPTARPFAPRLVRSDDDAAHRIQPQSGAQSVELHDPAVQEIADSLADLFLGPTAERGGSRGDDHDALLAPINAGRPTPALAVARPMPAAASVCSASQPRAQALPSVEMLVLGHLPVLAGAWLTQYASQAAQTLGKPLALARLEPGGLSIDIFGLTKEQVVSRHETLDAALAAAAPLVGGWLVRVDELAEAGLAESPRVGAITLLSGVSESSIVAAYRTLKNMVQRARKNADASGESEACDERPHRGAPLGQAEPEAGGTNGAHADLRIALLGASPERAREASGRIRKAAATFLGRPVSVVVCAERIGLTGMRSLYRGPFELGAPDLLARVDASVKGEHRIGPVEPIACRDDTPNVSRPTPTPAPSAPLEGEPRPARDGPRMLADLEHDLGPRWTAEGSRPTDQDTDWLLEPVAEASALPARVAPARSFRAIDAIGAAPTPVAAPPAPEIGSSPASLAPSSLAPMLALSSLPIRCPDAPRVELAVDSTGGLHAIVLDEMSAEGAESSTGRAGVAALLAADAWATANMPLIARAMPFVKPGPASLHLLTRIPAAARDLLGTRVKVHLLARATGPGDVCVGLN